MSGSFLLVVLGTVLNTATALTPSQFNTKIQTSIPDFLEKRCKQNDSTASSYAYTFFANYNASSFQLPGNKDQFCNDANLIQDMKTLSEKIRPCLLAHEKYLSSFMYESFTSFINFFCAYNGKNMDTYYMHQGNDCKRALNNIEAGPETEKCFSQLMQLLQEVVKKEYLCKSFMEAKECFSGVITRRCFGFFAFKNLSNNFFDSISKPCNTASEIALNSFLIITLIKAVIYVSYF